MDIGVAEDVFGGGLVEGVFGFGIAGVLAVAGEFGGDLL